MAAVAPVGDIGALLAALTLAGPAAASMPLTADPSPYTTSAPGATTQAIIRSDGRICNPRWGC